MARAGLRESQCPEAGGTVLVARQSVAYCCFIHPSLTLCTASNSHVTCWLSPKTTHHLQTTKKEPLRRRSLTSSISQSKVPASFLLGVCTYLATFFFFKKKRKEESTMSVAGSNSAAVSGMLFSFPILMNSSPVPQNKPQLLTSGEEKKRNESKVPSD